MPELSRFYGIIIKMYFNDTQQHHKPHIHAFYGDYEAVVAVDGDLLAGSIPAKQLKIIIGWLAIHEEEVYKPGIMPYEENTSIRLIHYKENYNV